MKKAALALLALLLCIPAAALPSAAPPTLHIGVLTYNGSDAFMSDVFSAMLAEAEGVAKITFLDSQNMQTLQNEQVELLLSQNVDALIINAVDRTAAVYLVRMIAPHDIPVIFINREPLYQDILLYEKAYYVGNNPKESGAMCGELIADYFSTHKDADKNGDGVIQYVLLRGEPGHQDAELRTKHSAIAMREAGFMLEKLADEPAMWERAKAKDLMAGFLSMFDGRIECVIANNDDMALGAIEALKAAGYFTGGKTMPVVGVDAIAPALEAIREGTMLGTVLNDSYSLADAALQLAVLLARGEDIAESGFGYSMDPKLDRYIWTGSRKITLSTLSP